MKLLITKQRSAVFFFLMILILLSTSNTGYGQDKGQAETINPPLSERTPLIRDAIVAAVPGINSADDVTAAHLAVITTLNSAFRGITSLKSGDFNGLIALTYLNLSGNSIGDISVLEDLTTLTSLYLASTAISDISVLENLTALKYLYLTHNSISDISVLQNLTALTELSLGENSVSDISVLEDLTTLKTLILDNNSISDVSVLENLTTLKSLYLNKNPISDYGPLRRLIAAIKAADRSLTLDITIPPEFTEGTTATRTVAENTAASVNIGTAVAATDADNDTLTYTLGGTDAAAFSIVRTSGQLQTSAALDFETKNSYSVTVDASDGKGGSDSITITINVTDVNEAPVFSQGTRATLAVAEHAAPGTNIGVAFTATDPDSGDILTYSLRRSDKDSFSIDPDTGQLQTRVPLDYETKNSYNDLAVRVTDSGGLIDAIIVTINITDVNKNKDPVFTDGSSATRAVAENTSSEQNIGIAVSATDADNDTLTYGLSGTDADSFSIVSTSGQLQTSAALDFETKNSYSVTVDVSDGNGGSTSIPVTISVTEVNEAPSFPTQRATRSVAENTASGQAIGDPFQAKDPDNGDILTYSLRRSDKDSFSIDPSTGQLQTRAALDYETKNSYNDLAVRVTDSGGLTDAIIVTINVTDVNENRSPVFTDGSATTRYVAENTGSGQDIGSAVSATDPDNDTLTYTLGGADAASFGINGTNGQLQTNAALNYESDASYSVIVSVSDSKGGSDSISVTINVTDVNEAPAFKQSSLTRSVPENTGSGTSLGNALDVSDPDRNTLSYTLGGPDATSFSFDSTTRRLQTSTALDYETKTSYSVTVSVSDGSLTDTITITVNVADVNEAPSFTEGSSATRAIAENTASETNIGSAVAATDPDDDPLTYTLGGADAASFSINGTNGQLQTKAALDYETQTAYTVTITVSDTKLTDTIDVTINVTNVNEAPSFANSTATRSIAENTASGEDIGDAVVATDPDTGDTLTYILGGMDVDSFSIVNTSGQLRTHVALDHETKASYSVTVTATDGDNLSDTTTVTITVTNVNEAPSFTEGSSATRAIAENTASETNIGSAVAATDPDDDPLTYTLGGADAASFSINGTNGQLQTSAALDYETQTSYTLTITVSDSELTDTIDVTINVTNANEAPNFANSTATRSIRENTASGEDIGDAVAATDPDSDDTLTYILGGTDADSFSIVNTSGQLRTHVALDHETKASYSVTITATDGDNLSDTTTVTINVTDVNEAPSFTDGSSATRTIAENTAAGTNIGTPVAATDVDANTTLTYTLGGTDAESFSIDSTNGQLQTKAALDYETQTAYTVTMTVSDTKLTDTIDVRINVTDVDENRAPAFVEGASTTRAVAENTAADTNIGSAVSATDPDDDTLTYTLGGADAAMFRIDNTNGQLRTSAALDYETETSYTVRIIVSDTKLTDTIDVRINVTDVNENRAPEFNAGSSTTRSIAENTAFGENIGSPVAATDADTGNTLTYTLGGTDESSFSIVGTNGQLKTRAALDYEAKSSYSVTVSVSDGNGSSDNIDVTITVTNVNEAPSFATNTATRSIAENTAANTNIGAAFTATDVDDDTLTYTLGGADAESFRIVSTSGQLKTNVALDHETKTTYAVTVTATDGDNLSDTISVTINVTNVNEAPSFTEGSTATRTIPENTAAGTNIGTPVAATDVDANTTLTYTLSGTDADSFSIVSTNGQLRTSAALDYETKTSYSVTVSVSDSEGSTDTIDVTINVTDVDENRAPVFTDGSTATRAVAENTSLGQNIGTALSATDADNDTLTYSLSGTDAPSFSIVNTSGQLQTSAALDYETKVSYTVIVSVSDGNGGSDSITVTINVTDVDETPIDPPLSDRTQQVQDAIVAAVPGVNAAADVTGAHLAAITSLDLKNKSIASLKVGDFDGLTNLTELHLGGNALTPLPSGIFDELKKLTHLNLRGNVLTTLSAGIFDELSSLTNLNLEFNKISDVSALESLTSLKVLYLMRNPISDYGPLRRLLAATPSLRLDITIPANNAPVFTDGSSTTRSVAEHTASGTNIGTSVSATDANNNTLTYSLSGTDADAFSIVSTSGQLQTKAALDYETKVSYTVIVSVSDGNGGSDSITVTINVINVNETPANNAPVFTDGSTTTRAVAEHTVSGTNIGTAIVATDADNHTLTYSLGGTDTAFFSIVSTSGQLQTKATLDYETKVSYTVIVSVSDGNGGSDSVTVTINVTDVDETLINLPFRDRTQQVQDAIVAAVPGVDAAADVTEAHLAAITSLDLNDKNITSLKVGDFDGLTNLTALTLIDNALTSLPSGIFDGLKNLTALYLGRNALTTLPSGIFDELKNLEHLTLSSNALTSLPSGIFDELKKLEEIYLSGNALTTLPSGIFDELKNLDLCYLGNNALTSLPSGVFDELKNLTAMSLSTNALTALSSGIFDGLKNLKKIALDTNAFTTLPSDLFEELTKLEEIFLGGNALTTLPSGILDGLEDLKLFYLGNNALTSLPSGIFDDPKNLRVIALARNALTTLPSGVFDGLTKLTTLNLGRNALTTLPSGIFDELSSLTKLYLDSNEITLTTLPSGIFDELSSLTKLYLDSNEISDVSTLEGLRWLKNLYLMGNPISDYTPLRRLKAANPGVNIDINLNNNPPQFSDGASTTRAIAENTGIWHNIGDAVSATDADGHTLAYTLGGTDASSFFIVGISGQLKTKEALDFETKTTYTVTVTVDDGNHGIDRITVTITVTDVVNAAPSVQTPPALPQTTELLSNFPNPFNPETWIPYQLAKPAEVTITIYDVRGRVVRTLRLGNQPAGLYRSRSKAAHWDGRNHLGEKVATGVYFYTLKAGDYSATRKLLIRK